MRETPAKSFKDLLMWQKAHVFTLRVYALSATFPQHELYGLTSQIRRAAVSIPGNIAEGFRRRTRNDKARLMNVAEASLHEVRYYLLLAHDLSYGNDPTLDGVGEEISRMLAAYTRTLRAEESDS